ncbi:hypothetical protein Zm00014a_043933 [Zea mays]|uniref:Helicase C-terminal domain-containing protein n=1 Tax=Zea mays TaxID=4577 RepID=A0A3L6EXW7_MAIZE|nr:hypothetical protein Zm00014a_043933 [Zea mays]PWZ25443.1 hypothetical protein Zm00014a_043933 [Zea mays]
MLLDIIRPHINRLRDAGVIDHRDYSNWTQFELLKFKDKFKEVPPPNIHEIERGEIERSFVILGPLCHTRKLLLSHGTQFAHGYLDKRLKGGSLNLMHKNEFFWRLKEKMKLSSSHSITPKVQELKRLMVEHFNTDSNLKDSRIIIFSHYRESVNEIYCSLQDIDDKLVRPVEFIGQSSAGNQLKGQSQKTQQAILKKFRSGVYNVLVATSIGEEGLDIIEVDLVICFDANVSPLRMIQRMGRTGRKNEGRVDILLSGIAGVPHVYKPEVKYVKLTIDKYIPHAKKMRVAAKEASPIPWKMSEADGQMITRYFSVCKEEVWRPSLVAFPRFQLYPSVVHKVPHSFRTTDMLTDAMKQLQDPSLFRTKCEIPLQEPANVSAVEEGLEHEGLYAANGNEEMPQECDGLEASSSVVWNENVSVPGSPVKKYPVHTFFSGDYVTVDRRGSVLITYVPVLPQKIAFSKDIKSAVWNNKDQNKAKPYRSAAGVCRTTVEFVLGTNTDKHLFVDNLSTVAMHSPECSWHGDNVDDNHVLTTVPSKTLTSPREKMDTPCNVKLPESTYSYQEDMELNSRLTVYMEEGIVPESPVVEVSHLRLEMDEAADFGAVPKRGSPKSRDERAHANVAGSHKGPLNFEKNDQLLCGENEFDGSSRLYMLDQTRAKTEEPMHPSNVKMATTTRHTPGNMLCDSFSGDYQLRSGGDASGSVQQAPKYRRLCKYGDKIKRVSSISLDGCDDRFEECNIANKDRPNQIKHAMGTKRKTKRRLDAYIDEEVGVSEDAYVSEDEDDNQSEDKYEDSFIDDQATPTEFTQTEQGDRHNGDMMGFYRQSLFTQSPVVLPSRYLDVSYNSASRTGNSSYSSEARHNYTETPKEIQTQHHTINPSPSYSFVQDRCERGIANCESSTKLDCRKRRLSFQQPLAIPVINLEPEPAPEPSPHVASRVADHLYLMMVSLRTLILMQLKLKQPNSGDRRPHNRRRNQWKLRMHQT